MDHRVRASLGQRIVTEDLDDLYRAVRRLLPKEIPAEALFQSLRHLAGATLTEHNLHDVAWRLAGNLPRLRAGIAVPPWNRQVDDEYVPVQIQSVQKTRRFHNIYVEWSAIVLAGTPVGLHVHKVWSEKFCRALARRLGFSKPWQPGRYDDAHELFGMRFYVLIESRLCGTSPGFETIWYDEDDQKIRPPAFYEYNRTLIKMRQRPDDFFPCPEGMPSNLPCRLCAFGVDQCAAATHQRTYEQRRCDSCDQDDAYFDPGFPARAVCVECHQRNQLRRDD